MIGSIKIAIDGYSSCGKSTLAKQLASKLNYMYVDSGAMYRAVTLYFFRHKINLSNEEQVNEALQHIHITFRKNNKTNEQETYLNDENVELRIRKQDISEKVSPVATLKAVREKMVDLQRAISMGKGIVMDGRDIGTVVFPDAELKIFMTAAPEVRAKRRVLDLKQKGFDATYEEVLENLTTRDDIDSNRQIAPLRHADDAIILDNSILTEEEQLDLVLDWAQQKIRSKFAI